MKFTVLLMFSHNIYSLATFSTIKCDRIQVIYCCFEIENTVIVFLLPRLMDLWPRHGLSGIETKINAKIANDHAWHVDTCKINNMQCTRFRWYLKRQGPKLFLYLMKIFIILIIEKMKWTKCYWKESLTYYDGESFMLHY
jgi:hypothetical protein